jgi:hypothetical protein
MEGAVRAPRLYWVDKRASVPARLNYLSLRRKRTTPSPRQFARCRSRGEFDVEVAREIDVLVYRKDDQDPCIFSCFRGIVVLECSNLQLSTVALQALR